MAPDSEVLIVEDNRAIGELLQTLVEEIVGASGIVVHSTDEAIAWLQERQPCLVLVELTTPGAVTLLSGLSPGGNLPPNDIPLLVTAAHCNERACSLYPSRCADCIRQPFDIDRLIEQIRRSLGV